MKPPDLHPNSAGLDEVLGVAPPPSKAAAAGGVLTEAQLARWGAGIRQGTVGAAWTIARVRKAIFESGFRGLEADRRFDAAMRQVLFVASNQSKD